ncbi:MAG: CHAP domain-containing protein [Candidatus Saccharibacteria bacterium]|nr:CHAP domain-containing protein [Candidatus Saccharibacteria bacterium]
MKLRSTTPVIKRFATSSMIVASAVAITFSSVTPVFADRYDDQINALKSQISGYQAEASKLGAQADTLQNTVNELQAQQNTIQAQINLSQAKYDQLVAQIKDTEDKIARNKSVLKETLTDLYVNDKTSPIEMIASSKNIGDYLDQQEYRNTIRERVETSINQIKKLKIQLEQKRDEAKKVLDDQQAQKSALAAKQAEQANILAQTQNNEAAFQGLIGQQNSQINSLRAQQAAANSSRLRSSGGGSVTAGDPGRGGYPSYLANAGQDTVVDPWGMYNRECVSYTAWKVQQAYGYMPYWGGSGNANQWPGNARRAGIATGSTPRVGSVAVMSGGYYGHVAWVESVNGGTIRVSQYNWGVRGEYSEMTVSASAFDTYIYFGG